MCDTVTFSTALELGHIKPISHTCRPYSIPLNFYFRAGAPCNLKACASFAYSVLIAKSALTFARPHLPP